jgi:hypothetical protein
MSCYRPTDGIEPCDCLSCRSKRGEFRTGLYERDMLAEVSGQAAKDKLVRDAAEAEHADR